MLIKEVEQMKKIIAFVLFTLTSLFIVTQTNITNIHAKTKEEYGQEYFEMTDLQRRQKLIHMPPLSSYVYYDSLETSDEKIIYNHILEALKTQAYGAEVLLTRTGVAQGEESALMNRVLEIAGFVLNDNKTIFWLNGAINIRMTTATIGELSTCDFTLTFDITDSYVNDDDTINLMLIQLHMIEVLSVRSIIVDEVSSLTSAYDKYKHIHDWLVLNNEYQKTNDLSHTPVGAMVEGQTPVCEAYAEAFMIIAHYAGLDALYITGEIVENGELHAWNNVFIEGLWYFVDVTWDDPIGPPPEFIGYDYFLIPNLPVSQRTIDPSNINPTPFATSNYDVSGLTYTVTFMVDDAIYHTETIAHGGTAPYPNVEKEGFKVVWDDDNTNITSDRIINGRFVPAEATYEIKFVMDGSVIATIHVEDGTIPSITNPTKEGYTFKGWTPELEVATEDAVYTAMFEKTAGSDLPTAGEGSAAEASKDGIIRFIIIGSIIGFGAILVLVPVASLFKRKR